MRFYVDGLELEIQDPTFFMDEQEYNESQEYYMINNQNHSDYDESYFYKDISGAEIT